MKVVCSINAYEPLILKTKTSQSNLNFQELQTFVNSQRHGKYSNTHWKGQINSGFNEMSFTSYSDDHWLDKCKNRICGKTEIIEKINALEGKGRSVARILLSEHQAAPAGFVGILEKLNNMGCFVFWCKRGLKQECIHSS